MMAGKLRNRDDVIALCTCAVGEWKTERMIELYSAKSPDKIGLSACFTCSKRREYESVNVTCHKV